MTASPVPMAMPLPIAAPPRFAGSYQPSFDDIPSSPVEDARSHWSGSPRSDAGEPIPPCMPEHHQIPASAPASSHTFAQMTPLTHPVAINYGSHYQHATSEVRGSDPYDPSSSHSSWRSSYLANPKHAYRAHPAGMLVSAPIPVRGWSDLSDLRVMASPQFKSRPQPPAYFAPSSLDSASTAPRTSNEFYDANARPEDFQFDGMPHAGLVSSTDQLPMVEASVYRQQAVPSSAGSSYQRDIPQTPPSATFPQYTTNAPGFGAPYPQPVAVSKQWGEQELLAVDEVSDEDKPSGEKRMRSPGRHVCPVCDKRFNRPSSLNTHMSVHTGAKPYQCPKADCARRFSVSSNLRRHMRTHDSHGGLKKERADRSVEMSPVDISSSDEGHQLSHYVPPHMQNAFPGGFSTSYPPPGQYPPPQLYTPTPAFADMRLTASGDLPRSESVYALTKTVRREPKTPVMNPTDKLAQNSSFYSPISFARP